MAQAFVPMDPDTQLGYLLVRCGDQQARAWQEALRAHGVNPRQFSMLASLAHDPGISQAELARRVMVTPQSMSESLTRLIDDGLIARGSTEPGRPARLGLTEAGRRALERAYPVVSAHQEQAFAALTADEKAELARVLGKLTR
ncbi:DNA-binding MarR family transcriptional regulator [Krasilnikovia cinnamomea]|uniref:DNA-binding MarR family transcriptional regulator n=1 Tax=Krasilnikovia cinnamomea TaxID=349313 RepID=A0A4Q7ZPV9_9ACTN|nr:MarR family transcriptional regulator [Krasilnikovia cinnamomea]RZU53120.1 DNA-binding MarR family transcriptional regulator [Krasilnikovia cinnamomea]